MRNGIDLSTQVPVRFSGTGSEVDFETMMEAEKMHVSCTNVLDIDQIADLFHCSRETVKRMARSGELPAFKFGKRWYVLRNDLEHFVSDKVESNRHLRRIQEVSP